MSLNYVYVIYFTLTAYMRLLICTSTQQALRKYGQHSCNDECPRERRTTSPATMDSLRRDGRPLLPGGMAFFTGMDGKVIYVDYVNLSKINLC